MQPGETLLVNGAAGGVGLAAIQVGKALGARVIACASTPDKIALAASYGADCCINYMSESVRDRRWRSQREGRRRGVRSGRRRQLSAGDAAVGWHARMLIVGFASGTWQQIPANIVLVKNISVMSSLWGAELERDSAVRPKGADRGAGVCIVTACSGALPGKTYALKTRPTRCATWRTARSWAKASCRLAGLISENGNSRLTLKPGAVASARGAPPSNTTLSS